jgi:hypothetical protein
MILLIDQIQFLILATLRTFINKFARLPRKVLRFPLLVHDNNGKEECFLYRLSLALQCNIYFNIRSAGNSPTTMTACLLSA